MNMGFPESRCRKALAQTGNMGPDMALNWLFENLDSGAEEQENPGPSQTDVTGLIDMGFSEKHALKALKETVSLSNFRTMTWKGPLIGYLAILKKKLF